MDALGPVLMVSHEIAALKGVGRSGGRSHTVS